MGREREGGIEMDRYRERYGEMRRDRDGQRERGEREIWTSGST